MTGDVAGAETSRLASDASEWKMWGPYVSERAWGTVREDYSERGEAWEYFPHDHARSRAYRWNEEGLGGVCDSEQRLCLSFAFWNGQDPILKERIFGLTGNEGNHGEDAKEYWWYLDSTPTHSWMRWRYVYPQQAFPYGDLVAENRRRGRQDPEFELLDTGIFDDDRYWEITADYAKAAPHDMSIRLQVRNAGQETATLHVLPTLWFRNTWAWGTDDRKPSIAAADSALEATHHSLDSMTLHGDGNPTALFCNNETNTERLWGVAGEEYPKDGIGDHVVHGASTIDPDECGTKAALHYVLTIEAGQTREIRLRFGRDGEPVDADFDDVLNTRSAEADAFYRAVVPAGATAEEAMIARQALSGMLWSKQFYHFDVERWLDGDPAGKPLSPRAKVRNSAWRHLNNCDVISMPDKWEYPWYAAWDLAFHCVALAEVDSQFAKDQLVLLCREWYMHPDGQLPAYEWAFGDVNPPVHAWAALRVFEADGSKDFEFLERVTHKLLLNFTWWVNRKDEEGNNVFEGGFLGLDNIGPIDRSAALPEGGRLEQSDGTAWMAMFCLNMLEMTLALSEHDETYEDLATKFLEHFTYIASAMDECGLWSAEDGFYYDVLHLPGAEPIPLRVRSMVGLLPLAATTTLSKDTLARLPDFAARFEWFRSNKPQHAANVTHSDPTSDFDGWLLSIVSPERLPLILSKMFDEEEFLSPFGLRSLAASHRESPFVLSLNEREASVGYEPAESESGLFGGNSNWRGPIWFPLNYLLIESLDRFACYLDNNFTIDYPTGSGENHNLTSISDDLSSRLVSLFANDAGGRRPVFGESERFQDDPAWHNQFLFYEYFDGDSGQGLGASHQTGWTGLVAKLIGKHS